MKQHKKTPFNLNGVFCLVEQQTELKLIQAK